MTDEQWKRTFELYEAVSNLPHSSAQEQLTAVSDDPAVIEEVTRLLKSAPHPAPPPPQADQSKSYTGAVIGRYEVLDLLGRGSNGEVYSGRDRDLGRRIALKFMSSEGASSEGWQFIREAQAASALNHPNIVTVHEVITWNSAPVIVMELVEGNSLRTLCSQPMPLAQANHIGLQIMQALAFVHANGIIHRDLKPENVIVRPDGYVKVLDFGLARRSLAGESTSSISASHAVGTLLYMSPEQCRVEPATAASDVFSAAIVLYEMFAGRHPFRLDSPLDTAHAIASQPAKPPSHWNKAITPSLDLLILRMLAKDPGARPSAREVEQALNARRTAGPAKSKVHRLYGVAAVMGVLTLCAVTGLLLTHETRNTPSTPDLPVANFDIVPVAGMTGVQRMPSISADGTKVAFEFTSASSLISHIYLKVLAVPRVVNLTNDKLPDLQPVFSPDGSAIAFLRREKEVLHVMVMPSSGGIATKVGDVSEIGSSLSVITWDPQGSTLIVSDSLHQPQVQVALFALSVADGTRRQLTFPKPQEIDCMPIVSPDGRTLGFARVLANQIGRLWSTPIAAMLASKAGQELRPLTYTDQPIASWAWSSGDRSLLIARMNGERISLWRQPAAGSTAVRVSGIDDQVAQLSVPRVGRRLVYALPAPGNVSLWLYSTSPSLGAPRQLISSDLLDVDVRFSPDGRNVVFASARDGETSLWICAKDGSNLRKFTSFEEGHGWAAGSPNWSPDGKWIAFDAGSGGEPSSIFVLDSAGGKLRRLTASGFTDAVPSWSPDGRWIYFCSERGGRQDIWKVPASGGAAAQVTHNTGFECTFSPDGQILYYTKPHSAGMWRLSLASGDDRPVPGLEDISSRSWQGTSKGIYFVVAGSPAVLRFFNFANQKTHLIRTLPAQPNITYRGLSVSPDGQSILYAQKEDGRANVMLVKNFH